MCAIILVAAIVISFLIKTFLIRSFYIPSESMEATLIKNDRIIVNELVPDLTPIDRGDVVVFKDPGGWLDPVVVPEQNPVVGFFDWLLSFVGADRPRQQRPPHQAGHRAARRRRSPAATSSGR